LSSFVHRTLQSWVLAKENQGRAPGSGISLNGDKDFLPDDFTKALSGQGSKFVKVKKFLKKSGTFQT
jgi:hypothetical protein